jgi:hypothetical protein
LHAFHFQHNITPTPTVVFLLRAIRSTPACHLSSNKWLTSWSAPTTIGIIGPEFCSGDAQKGRQSSRELFIPAAQPLAAAQAPQATSRRVTKLVKAAHFHAAYGVHAGTGMVVKPVAFGIWLGLSPKETRSRGWDWEFESGFLQRRVCKLSVPYG